MSALSWNPRINPTQPLMIVAYEGWNDAGEASTMALAHLGEQWGAVRAGTIGAEEFFDFTTYRPSVSLDASRKRQIEWPDTKLWFARLPNGRDVVLVRGVEPQLKWRSYCSHVRELIGLTGVRLVVTLGSLLAEVPHTRPVPVYGSSQNADVQQALHLEASDYEGPTGIIGVLVNECEVDGVKAASLWAAVPSYVPSAPSPIAAQAVVERVGAMLHVEVDVTGLAEESETYVEQISTLVAEDDQSAAYVAELEIASDSRILADESADDLVHEVEKFLQGL